jgi:Putative peptidoglycan binding domain
VSVYPADKNGRILWRRGKTVDASKILDPSVFESAPEAPLFSAPVVFRIGSTGDAVASVQEIVGRRGVGLVRLPKPAVKDYQRSKGLVPDGIVGPQTIKGYEAALECMGVLGAQAIARPNRVSTAPCSGPVLTLSGIGLASKMPPRLGLNPLVSVKASSSWDD